MKRIVLMLLLVSLAVGCSHGLLNQVRGSGNRQREERKGGMAQRLKLINQVVP